MCRQVTVSEDFIVPAHHEANVSVRMADRDILHPANIWVIETTQLGARVMTARTLVNAKQERLVARICNYSDEPFELKTGYCLARAEPVEFIPGPGEKWSDHLNTKDGVNVLSVSTGATMSTDLPSATRQDPATTSSATTLSASTTAAGADTPVADATAAAETLFADGQADGRRSIQSHPMSSRWITQ